MTGFWSRTGVLDRALDFWRAAGPPVMEIWNVMGLWNVIEEEEAWRKR